MMWWWWWCWLCFLVSWCSYITIFGWLGSHWWYLHIITPTFTSLLHPNTLLTAHHSSLKSKTIEMSSLDQWLETHTSQYYIYFWLPGWQGGVLYCIVFGPANTVRFLWWLQWQNEEVTASQSHKEAVSQDWDWDSLVTLTAKYKKQQQQQQQPVTGQSVSQSGQLPPISILLITDIHNEGVNLTDKTWYGGNKWCCYTTIGLFFVTVGLSTVLMESEHKIHFKMKISHFPCQNPKSELAALRDERWSEPSH